MKRWLVAVAAMAVLCCGAATAGDAEGQGSIGKDPDADYWVGPKDLAKIYRAMAEDMADLTAQRRKVFLILQDGTETPTGPATQVALIEETECDLNLLKLFAVDEAGAIYTAEWKPLETE